MPQKKPAYKSKTVVVVYYGSNDLADPLASGDVEKLAKKLSTMRPADVRVLPTAMVGNKIVKLQTETLVLVEGKKWKFEHRVPALRTHGATRDAATNRAMESLDSALASKTDAIALVPHYLKVVEA